MRTPSSDYIKKVQSALRLSTNTFYDEIKDLITECRIDLVRVGILPERAEDERDSLVLAAVKLYVGWKFTRDIDLSRRYKEDYIELKEDMRKHRNYIYANGGDDDVAAG